MAGVKTQNLFDLLGSDVEDEEVVAPVETEAPVEAKAKDAPQPGASLVCEVFGKGNPQCWLRRWARRLSACICRP